MTRRLFRDEPSPEESTRLRKNRAYTKILEVVKLPENVSSGMRTLKTHFETVSDWSVVKWSVLIGQSLRPRD